MSLDRYPPRSEVMGWNPQQLAEYLKRVNLASCEKTVLKNSISGSRFVNMTDNDLQKFPKTMAPMISKISNEISKKEEKRGLFSKKPTPKYHEPTDAPVEAQGWGDDEFDHDDDYESPFSGDEDDSGGDYESPNEEVDGNDYEPPPTEPPDDLPSKLCRAQGPIGDDDYIDNHVQSRSNPPAVSPRPPMSTLSAPSPRPTRESSTGRDPSPHCGGRPSGKLPPEPPQIFRNIKPGRSNPSPIRGPHRNTVERPGAQAWKPQPDGPDPPAWTKPSTLPPNSTSSARPPPNRLDAKKEQTQDAPKHNTFPLHSKGLPPRPGIPGPPSRHGDSLPPNVTPPGASLPQKLQSVLAEHRASFSGADNRPSLRPAAPTAASCSQELDPVWYVGKVTRGQAEGCLRRVNKDGAYLVRDSTRQQANQPFTLMVLYQGKVYNIQIRQQNQQFMLGTGLKAQECFPSVHEIIDHYFQFPLLLIDAKSRSINQQNQCVLSDPAGYYMTGQSWS